MSTMDSRNYITLLNIPVTTKTLNQLSDEVVKIISEDVKGRMLFCANPNSLVVARQDNDFLASMQEADWMLPDGMGVVLVMKIFGQKNIRRITGYDMMTEILHKFNNRGKGSVFFLGSTDEVLSKIYQRIQNEFPVLKVGTYSPPFKQMFTTDENLRLIKIINQFNPGILFVGMTAPKQEKWVYQNRNKLNVPILAAVGAAFDFYAGTKKRAPTRIQSLGLEWLWRLVREPKRLWHRTIVSAPIFIFYVLKQLISKSIKSRR